MHKMSQETVLKIVSFHNGVSLHSNDDRYGPLCYSWQCNRQVRAVQINQYRLEHKRQNEYPTKHFRRVNYRIRQ